MQDQLMGLLKEQLGNEDMINKLSEQLGGASQEETKAATDGILSTLMAGLARNTSTQEGADALGAALERDHDGSILDDFIGNISGQNTFGNQNALNSQGILGHILGGKQGNAVDMISQMSGLAKGNTGKLMMMLAPMLMGALGKVKTSQGLDSGGLASILTGALTQRKQETQSQGGGSDTIDMITSFIDSDGDGNIMDDLGNLGKGLLGGLFK